MSTDNDALKTCIKFTILTHVIEDTLFDIKYAVLLQLYKLLPKPNRIVVIYAYVSIFIAVSCEIVFVYNFIVAIDSDLELWLIFSLPLSSIINFCFSLLIDSHLVVSFYQSLLKNIKLGIYLLRNSF